jgi:hypothetical protein
LALALVSLFWIAVMFYGQNRVLYPLFRCKTGLYLEAFYWNDIISYGWIDVVCVGVALLAAGSVLFANDIRMAKTAMLVGSTPLLVGALLRGDFLSVSVQLVAISRPLS